MNRKRFVAASSVLMVMIAGLVAGLALYTGLGVRASGQGLPEAVAHLPADTVAVFGMNVQRFLASPFYARVEEKHGDRIGKDLTDFIAQTGVDPRRDLHYIIAGGRAGETLGHQGVAIAVGSFNTSAITTFINSKHPAAETAYKGVKMMMPQAGGSHADKGIAFLSESEIAVGDETSLKQVIDVYTGTPGIMSSPSVAGLLSGLQGSEEMFWFAGDAEQVLSKSPTHNALGSHLSSVKDIVGTLNLTEAVTGKITATAKDEESAGKLADVARGFVALGQLAGDQNPSVAELMRGVSVVQEKNRIELRVNFSIELLEKVRNLRLDPKKVI